MTFHYHREPRNPVTVIPWRRSGDWNAGTFIWTWTTKRRAYQRAHVNRLKRRRLNGDL